MVDAPRVFLSYSHDSDEHADRVLAFADALRSLGIDVTLDRYLHPAPAEGWPRWMDRNLDESGFVLMVCTETYRRRVMGREEPGKGLGVRWEGGLIYNRIYHDEPSGSRFIPVLLPGSDPAHIPNPVQGHSYYRIATFDLADPGYQALYRHLTDQPDTPRPGLGPVTVLPPRPRLLPSPGPLPPSGGSMTTVDDNIVGSTIGTGNTGNAMDNNPIQEEWPGELGAVETPVGLDLLPIDEQTPPVFGVAIDVSGSMQKAMGTASGDQKSRLQGVMESLRSLASHYHAQAESQEVTEIIGSGKLFAYGFGFADRAVKLGKLGKLAQRVPGVPPVPSRIFSGAVRDLLEVAGFEPHTQTLKEIESQWSQLEEGLWDQRMDFLGKTQMRQALETVARRFAVEFASYAGTPHSALFIVSDGESKDGSPVEACCKIAQQGTVIFSCYLSEHDVAEPRRLYARPQPGWDDAAKIMFRCSSVLEEDSLLLPVLKAKEWTANEGDRLFVQLNQSALVSEFVTFILDMAKGPKRS
jgi:hypothetical protein